MGFVQHSAALKAILFNRVTDDLDGGKNAQVWGPNWTCSPAQAWRILRLTITGMLTPWYTMVSQPSSLQTSRTGPSTPYVASLALSRTEGLPPSNCWHFSYSYSSGCFWSLPHGCIAGSCSICCTRTCRSISTKLLSKWSDSSMCWWIGLFLLLRYRILHFSIKLEVISVSPVLQSIEIFLKSSTTHWYVSHSCQFYILSTLPGYAFCPITSTVTMLITTGYYVDPQLYFVLLILPQW